MSITSPERLYLVPVRTSFLRTPTRVTIKATRPADEAPRMVLSAARATASALARPSVDVDIQFHKYLTVSPNSLLTGDGQLGACIERNKAHPEDKEAKSYKNSAMTWKRLRLESV